MQPAHRRDTTGHGATARPDDRVLVVVPTYDERDNLPRIGERLRAAVPQAHLLVVDDASPDGTGQLADEMSAADPSVHVLHRTGKRGLGRAYLDGFTWALAHGYDVVVEMDADGSHDPDDLPRLLTALTTADLVLGSRWVSGGRAHHWSPGRRLLSRAGNLWVRMLLRLPLRDATGGFRVFRRCVLEGVPLSQVASDGYCFQVEMAWRTWTAGFRVAEVPITFTDRVHGSSKMSNRIVLEALWRVTRWGLDRRFSGARRAQLGTRRAVAAARTIATLGQDVTPDHRRLPRAG